MTDKTKEYKKLSTARYTARNVKLWMGKDHLLLCESLGYTEDYKRFYFRDIQAVLMRPSRRRLFWNILLGSFLALFAILMLTFHDAGNWFLWFCCAFFFSFLVLNFFRGPGCYCHLKTAVQTIELPITRRKKAEKIVQTLKPLIDGAQANLPGGPAPVPVPFSPDPKTHSGEGTAASTTGTKPFRSWAHWLLFGFLFLHALTGLSRFFSLNLTLYIFDAMLGFGCVIPLIFALVAQAKSDASRSIQRVTMGVIVYVIAEYFLSVIWGAVITIQHPLIARDQWALIKMGASIGPDSSTFAAIQLVLEIAGSLLFCLIGTIELIRHHLRASAGPSSP